MILNNNNSAKDQGVSEFIISLNDQLEKTGMENAERAFGLGCFFSIIPLAILIAMVYIAGIRNWILITVIGIIGTVMVLSILTMMASRARANAVRNLYYRVITNRIDEYINRCAISKAEFLSTMSELLATSSPLRMYLEEYKTTTHIE